MNAGIRVSAALTALIMTTPATAQPGPPAAPAPSWIVNTDGPTCTVSRSLRGTVPAELVVRTYPGLGYYELVFAAESWPSSLRRRERVQMAFQPGIATFDHPEIFRVPTPRGPRNVIRFRSLPADFLRTFGAASTVSLRNGTTNVATYHLPRTSGVASVFADCERLKLIDWGADPAGFGPGAQRPRPIEESRWFDWEKIPAARRSDQLRIVASLRIGVDGRPGGCTVLESNLDAPNRAAVCLQLMQNARYEPARGPGGNVVRSVAIYQVDMVRTEEILIGG